MQPSGLLYVNLLREFSEVAQNATSRLRKQFEIHLGHSHLATLPLLVLNLRV